MWIYLGKRILQILLTLLLFQIVTYFLMDAQPGDIADLLTLNPDIPPAQREILRRDLGLDRPPFERAVLYISNFYKGDLGVSFSHYPRPVIDIIMERLPRTLVLFLSATLVSFWAGFSSGKVLAWKRGGLIEYSSTLIGVFLYTVFTPWFALMMIWIFSVKLGWLPPGKFLDPLLWLDTPEHVSANFIFLRMIWSALIGSGVTVIGLVLSKFLPHSLRSAGQWASVIVPFGLVFMFWKYLSGGLGSYAWDILSHLVLPVLTVTLIGYGGTMLLTRTSMLETLREDFILTAKAKGMPEKVIRDQHAARNALLPVWTGLVFSIGASLSGGIITETIFSWPGIGLTLLKAATMEDIPLAMGALTITGVLTLISHLVADIGYAFLDPRIRYH
jgi:peptide/nickel transport system permease protein